MRACTLCLQTNINVCQLGESAAVNFIQDIFVNNGYQQLSRYNYICLLCNFLLNKSYKFIQKTLRAQKALKDIVEEGTKITVATLRQIDRDKLDLDINLSCQEAEVNYHLYDAFDDSETKLNPLDNKTEADVSRIKTEQHPCGSDTLITSTNYFYNNDYNDTNYPGYENPIDDAQVKKEIVNEIEIKVDIEPYFNDALTSRRERKHVNYKELSGDLKKGKTKKVKSIKCEPKEEPDDDGNVRKSQRKRNKKTGKRGRPIKIIDPRKYPMKCDHCKHVVENKTEHFHHYLLYHRGTPYPYAREGKFMCQHCGVVKTTSHVLHEHELTHGEKKIACQQCGKLFHNDTRLKRHMKRHGAVLKICDYCNKGFVAREDLILHIRTHTGVKPFKCVICGAAFAHRGNVAIHMRSRHQQDISLAAQPTTSHDPDLKPNRGRKRKPVLPPTVLPALPVPLYYASPMDDMPQSVEMQHSVEMSHSVNTP